VVAFLVSHWMTGGAPVAIRPERVPIWQSAGGGVALGLALVGMSRWSSGRFGWARRLDENFRELLGTLTPGAAAFMAAMSGVAEELWFRGVLLRIALPSGADASTGAVIAAVVISSVIFGALHVGPDRTYLPWTAFAVVVGLLFGAVTVWTGDVTAAVLAHVTVNYFNFLSLGRAR
jgi:membrane protease YdiL (CAAX protease family)